jgi:hypothetical protein
MTKNNPLSQLRQKIEQEEQRTRKHACCVRISQEVALDLAKMGAADWHDASNGWAEMPQCKKFADEFWRDGVAAANGLRLSVVGPILEVSNAHGAPDVEITAGIPFDETVD